MNLIKSLVIASAVTLAPAFAFAQTPVPSGSTPAGAASPAGQTGEKGDRKGGPRGDRKGKAGERFKKADTNGDGALSKAEADAAGMKRLSANFDKIDTNKDGKITREEMKAAREARKGERKGRRGGADKGAAPATPATPAAPAVK